MVKSALKMLYAEKKKTLNLFFSILATLCIANIFLQFTINPYIATEITLLDIILFNENYALAWLDLGLMALCIMLMGYSCNYYMRVHSREFGLLKLAGYSFAKIVLYQMIQITALMMISFCVSLVLSFILVPLVLFIVYQYCGIHQYVFDISLSSFFSATFIVLVLMIIIILFIQCRYVNIHSIADLLKQNPVHEYRDRAQVFHVPDFLYLFAYILGLYVMYIGDEFSIGFVIASCIGIYGAYGIFYYWIPHTIEEALQDLHLKAENYIVLGNLSLFVQQSKTLIIFIMLSVILLPTFILASIEKPLLHISLHIGIVFTNIILSATLVNRFGIDLFEKKDQYQNLCHMGFLKKEVQHIAIQESFGFYFILWVSTSIYLVSLFIIFYLQSSLSFYLVIIILLEYTIPYLFSWMIVYWQRRNF